MQAAWKVEPGSNVKLQDYDPDDVDANMDPALAKADDSAGRYVRSSGSGFSVTGTSGIFVTSFFGDAPCKSGFAAIASPDLDSEELKLESNTIAGLAMLCLAVPRLRDCASANGIAQTPRSRSR